MNPTGHSKSKAFQKRILKVAIVSILACTWVISFAQSARVAQKGRLEQRAAPALAAEGARVPDAAGHSERAFRAVQANAAVQLRRNVVLGACSKLGTALALVALGGPLSLSVLSILFMRGAPEHLVHRCLCIPFRIRLGGRAASLRGHQILQREVKL
jgi:hypothetical protein